MEGNEETSESGIYVNFLSSAASLIITKNLSIFYFSDNVHQKSGCQDSEAFKIHTKVKVQTGQQY